MPIFKLVIRSSTGWSDRDQTRVLKLAGALSEPPAAITERGFELAMEAATGDEAKAKLEKAVHGIHSHTGVYLEEEIRQ
jgi:hypothetical protein